MPCGRDSGDGSVFDFTTECGFTLASDGGSFLAAKLDHAPLICLSGMDVDDADAALGQFGPVLRREQGFAQQQLGLSTSATWASSAEFVLIRRDLLGNGLHAGASITQIGIDAAASPLAEVP